MRPQATQLLVSVRNSLEAQIAITAPIGIVDVKEPDRGSLGCVDLDVLQGICRLVAERRPVSVALGELHERRKWSLDKIPKGVAFAKLGLAHCREDSHWPDKLREQYDRLPPGVRPVAVVYADISGNAPPPDQVVEVAQKLNCAAVLVDTYEKSGVGIVDLWSATRLAAFVQDIKFREMVCVIAGGLTVDMLPDVLSSQPHLIGVRGAVCRDGRQGTICEKLLLEFALRVSSHAMQGKP